MKLCARTRLELLEPRQLRSVASPAPSDGQDYHLKLDAGGDTIVTASADPMARKPFPEFKWYDGTHGASIIAAGGTAFETGVADAYHFWPWVDGIGRDASGDADEAAARELARNVADSGTELLVIDNEHWRFDIRLQSRAQVDLSVARTKKLIGWIRDERPQLKVGVYGYMSQSDDNNSVVWNLAMENVAYGQEWWGAALPMLSSAFAGWQATSEYLRGLSQSVDYIFPALYTGTTDMDQWERSARITIEDSRRYGKPVIPFIWPQYHQGAGGGLGFTEIPAESWQRQLDLVRECADGAYIWNAWAPSSPEAGWLTTTVQRTTPVVSQSAPLLPPLPASATTQREDDRRRSRFSDTLVGDLLLAA